MVGDPATSEAALPVTESGASEKQNSDGEGNGMARGWRETTGCP